MKSIIAQGPPRPVEKAPADHPAVSPLANTVHELRTPLASIVATLELLQLGVAPDESAELVAGAAAAAHHLDFLIADILDEAAIDAGHLRLHRNGHRVCDLLDELDRVVRLQAKGRGIELRIARTDVDLRVHTDDRRFLQIALNLVGNALKFAPRGGTVEVVVETSPSCARFAVLDDGPGIPESARSRLFTPFASIAPGSPVRGTGLGLALCDQLARHLGGRLGFEPRTPHGSRFWFELPRVVAPAPGAT